MLDTELENRIYSYAFYLSALACFVASIIFGQVYLLALAAILLAFAALYFKSGHVLNNFLLRKGKIIEICGGYALDADLNSAVKRNADAYVAVSCAELTGANSERNAEVLESLVYNASFPFEFSLGLRGVNHERVLDGLEEKRRLKEIEIARCDPKKLDRLNVLRRELGVLENEIRSIRANKMLALSMRLKTFASSRDEFEAAREAYRNMEQLAAAFSASLGVECEILRGERLLAELAEDVA